MRKSLALLKRFAREESGASMVEYGVLVGLITAALVAIIGLLGDELVTRFQTTLDAVIAG
jgi:pilus assembly protein Flp/PilA